MRAYQALGYVVSALFVSACICSGKEPNESTGRDGSSLEKAITIKSSLSESRRKEEDYIAKHFPNARIVPEERGTEASKDRWYDRVVVILPSGKKKIYFDVTEISVKRLMAVEGHILISHDLPQYPAKAKAERWKGHGILELGVGADGTVSDAIIVKSTGHDVLDEEAVRTFKTWRFRPEAKPFTARVPCDFDLPNDE